jgi:hypothetical protein
MNKQKKMVKLGLRENGLYWLKCETKSTKKNQGLVVSKESKYLGYGMNGWGI